MTCNLNWAEIVDNKSEGQTTSDRPDLAAEVFKLKLKELLTDILKRNVFGVVKPCCSVRGKQKQTFILLGLNITTTLRNITDN